jgi:hypothetical protein
LHKQQEAAFTKLSTDLRSEIDQKVNESKARNVNEDQGREHRAVTERVDDCIKQFSSNHPPVPYASFIPRQQAEDDGLQMAKAASDNLGYEVSTDQPQVPRDRTVNRGLEAPKNSTMSQSGYLPTRFQVPKHEETAAWLFLGGEEARTKWPEFYANFEHVATSYGWGYEMKGALLNRGSRDHALQVMKAIPEKNRMDYGHLVTAYNNAFIPSEWARAYRGSLNARRQAKDETFLQYAAALRKMAVIAYPSTDSAFTDEVREDRCLDVFLIGIEDPHIAVFVTNKKPRTMEDAVSAAEAYAAVWARKEDLPAHPDKMPPPDTMQAALVTPPAGNPKQPGAKPNGHKNYPKKNEGNSKKASNGNVKEKGWDNSQSELIKMMRRMLEEMCKGGATGSHPTQRSQPFHKDQKGKFNKPAPNNNGFENTQPRCYRCQKIGHFKRDCRVNIGCVDECCVTEWYCEDHLPNTSTGEDF